MAIPSFLNRDNIAAALQGLATGLVGYGSGNPNAGLLAINAVGNEKDRRLQNSRLQAIMDRQAAQDAYEAQKRAEEAQRREAASNALKGIISGQPGTPNNGRPGGMGIPSQPPAMAFDPTQAAVLQGMDPEQALAMVGQQAFAKPAGPNSSLAKLKDDLMNGRITQAEYDAALRKETYIAPSYPPQGPVTWSDIKDAKGNVIGQRSSTGQVNYFSNGPGAQQPGFQGNAMEAQATNILLTGDPNSAIYAAAYSALSQPKVSFDPTTGKSVIVQPDLSWARKPMAGGGTQTPPASGAVPAMPSQGQAQPQQPSGIPGATTTQLPGATITSTPGLPPVPQGYERGHNGVLTPQRGGPADTANNPEYRKQSLALSNLENAVTRYDDLVQKYGTVEVTPEGRAQLNNAYADLKIQMKEAANLGALTGPDVGILQDMIVEPNSLSGLWSGKAGVKEQAAQVKAQIKQKRENLDSVYKRGIKKSPGDMTDEELLQELNQ